MNDFLTNLAAKNHGLTETIQPRVASLFEPVPTMGKFSAQSLEANELHEMVTRDESEFDLSGETAHPFVESFIPTPLAQNVNQRPALFETERVPSRPSEFSQETMTNLTARRALVDMLSDDSSMPSSLRSEQRVNQTVAVKKEAVPISPEQLPQPSKRILRPAVNQSTEDVPMSQVNLTNQSTHHEKETDDKSEFRQRHPSPKTVNEQIVSDSVMVAAKPHQPVNSYNTLRPATVVVKPLVKPYMEPTDFKRIDQSAPPPPTIQVTIGRIEVRATSPAPPPSKPRAASTVMSLDEYLRRRQGGGA